MRWYDLIYSTSWCEDCMVLALILFLLLPKKLYIIFHGSIGKIFTNFWLSADLPAAPSMLVGANDVLQ